jgi:chromosomal replication initiator protein
MTPLSVALAQAKFSRWTPSKKIEPPKPEPAPIVKIAIRDEREEKIKKLEAALVAAKREAGLLPAANPSIRIIIVMTAAYFGVTVNDIKSARRTSSVVWPRQVAMYLAKKLTLNSLPKIGAYIGGRDHTTVLHGVRKIEAKLQEDADLQETVSALEKKIRSTCSRQAEQAP